VRLGTPQCVDDVCVTRDQFAEVFANQPALVGQAAAEAPSSGVAPGAPDGPPASGVADAGTATTTMSSDPALSTSGAWLTPDPPAANDNQPVAEEENEPQAQDTAPDPAPVLEAANDNPPPPSAEAI